MPTAPPRFGARPKQDARAWATSKATTTQRGYGWDHQKARRRLLEREPLCRTCGRAGITTVATIADHVVSLAEGGARDEGNLQPLCTPCSTRKTSGEALRGRQGQR